MATRQGRRPSKGLAKESARLEQEVLAIEDQLLALRKAMDAEKGKRKAAKWEKKYGSGSEGRRRAANSQRSASRQSKKSRDGRSDAGQQRSSGRRTGGGSSGTTASGRAPKETAVDRWRQGKPLTEEEEEEERMAADEEASKKGAKNTFVMGGGTFNLAATWAPAHLEELEGEQEEQVTRGEDTMTPSKGASIADGEFDEEANRREFLQALYAFRGEGDNSGTKADGGSQTGTYADTQGGGGMSTNTSTTSSSGGGGSMWDGEYDEEANRKEFQRALDEWRGTRGLESPKKKKGGNTETSSAAMETQTEGEQGLKRGTDFDFEWDDVPDLAWTQESTYMDELLRQKRAASRAGDREK